MKKILNIQTLSIATMMLFFVSCKKDYGNLNGPTVEAYQKDATLAELNNLVSGTESGMRNSIAFYLDDVGTIGREIYHFSNSEPRYVTDLLGASNAELSGSNFYIATPWASRYRVIKNCNTLIASANNTTLATDAQKKAYTGFAKTIEAYQLLMNLNLTDSNGIRIDVADPENLGPIVDYNTALASISSLLDDGKNDLTGSDVVFTLAGFSQFNDAAGLVKFNRALAARVDIYEKKWSDALNALNESFFDLNGDFYSGVNHVFGTGSGDQLNPVFIPQNQSGEVRVAHPSFAEDILPNDDRINKATLRNSTASISAGLSSNRDVWVYTSSTAPIPIIRNEELILIYAEANIQLNNFGDAINALNIIRNKHGLNNYSGAQTQDALIDELLYERRYSLYFEGHRWIDLRRYNKLDELPLDRPDDNVWSEFPLPVTEQ
ncbi:MAG: RagB/SusD family nutrient uptake outer membrane protein [Bacteroidetes bacterium]|nr:RagB/SusD family nutrient uptake outer membrane protein [Bacteroidota bacterium]